MNDKELLKAAQSGDAKARHDLAMRYKALCVSMAMKYKIPNGMERQDIVQCAYVGLLTAIDKFDTSVNVHFSTYARYRITKEIMDGVRVGNSNRLNTNNKSDAIRIIASKQSELNDESSRSYLEFSKRHNISMQHLMVWYHSKFQSDVVDADAEVPSHLDGIIEQDRVQKLINAMNAVCDEVDKKVFSYRLGGIKREDVGISLQAMAQRACRATRQIREYLKVDLNDEDQN